MFWKVEGKNMTALMWLLIIKLACLVLLVIIIIFGVVLLSCVITKIVRYIKDEYKNNKKG